MARLGAALLTAVLVAGLLLAAAPPPARADMSCGQKLGLLMPCLSYAEGTGPLTQNCCSGVRTLNDAAQTTATRQSTCRCLKSAAAQAGAMQMGNIAGIPSKCGVKIPYAISTKTDCAQVK